MQDHKQMSELNDSQKIGKLLAQSIPGEDVVIAGMAGRFPLSNNLDEFEENLFNKIHMPVQNTRWYPIKCAQNKCGVISNIEKFDAGFFGVHYDQAQHMDPQVRLLLENTFEAIVDAGYNPRQLAGSKIGVYVGSTALESIPKIMLNSNNSSVMTASTFTSLAQQISYFFDFIGPSTAADTACSSTVYALNIGYRAIKEGACDGVIVAGAHLCLHPEATNRFKAVLSPDNRGKAYHADSNGFIRAEGISVVFLLKEKLAKRIYAKLVHVKTESGYCLDIGLGCPSTENQAELMRDICLESNYDAKDIDFVEGHGTGTFIGDPLEVKAIDKAFCQFREEPLILGSSKSNVGHTETASGLVSLMKVIICMEQEKIAPTLHYDSLRPCDKALEDGRLVVTTEVIPLPKKEFYLAVINSLGFGGTNSVALIKSVAKTNPNKVLPIDDLPRLICVSGRTKEAVQYILDRVSNTKINEDFVRLLHEVFAIEIQGHLYRGYTIISKEGELMRSLREDPCRQKQISLILGGPCRKAIQCARYLSAFPVVKDIFQRVESIPSFVNLDLTKLLIDNNPFEDELLYRLINTLVQISVVELLIRVGINVTYERSTDVGEIALGYAMKRFSLDEAVLAAHNTNRHINYQHDFMVVKIGAGVVTDLVDCCDLTSFLTVLGSLYEVGCNFKVHELYPTVAWPVGKRTPSIGTLIKWNHEFDWLVTKYTGEEEFVNQERIINLRNFSTYWDNIKGHVVDGRNFVPATAYVYMVWETVALYYGRDVFQMPIKLENMQILRATSVSTKTHLSFIVMLHKTTRRFEIHESGTTIFKGCFDIDALDDFDDSILDACNKNQQVIVHKDIYKEYRVRGYAYTNAFKSTQEVCVDGSMSFIQWRNNWSAFMDNMLQGSLLKVHTRQLYVPISIDHIQIDPEAHLEYINKIGKDRVPTYYSRESMKIRCGYIEIKGISTVPLSRRKIINQPLLEVYKFVPFKAKLAVEESVRVCVQIACENFGKIGKMAVVELLHTSELEENLLTPHILNAFNDIPYIKCDSQILSKKEIEYKNVSVKIKPEFEKIEATYLIATFDILQNGELVNQIRNALQPNGMILTREQLNLGIGQSAKLFDLIVVAVYQNEVNQIVLLRKQTTLLHPQVVNFSQNKSAIWLKEMQCALDDSTSEVLIYSRDKTFCGLLGFFSCLKIEKGNRVKCFAIYDEAPTFDINQPFYFEQLQKCLATNVYEHGQWGTYRHLKLDNLQPVPTKYVVGEFTSIGNLASFGWFQNGDITANGHENYEPIDIYYSSLNFKDVMIASGRVLGLFGKENDIGFEFSGVDKRGKRCMGISESATLGNGILCSSRLLWEVPQVWSLEEAATVPIAYFTVTYAIITVGRIKEGQSILIHCGTGGVGQAAIHISLHRKCNIFVTVGTQEKRDFIKTHFPQIPESHIANSRDTSFEQHVLKLTKGKGVDYVLNSLAAEKMEASLRCLGPGGKLLEIGKYDSTQNRRLGLEFFSNNRSIRAITLDSILQQQLHRLNVFIDDFENYIKSNIVKPLSHVVFTREEVSDAFRLMSKGEHIGKVLIKMRDVKENEVDVFTGLPRVICNRNDSFIVIGGLGGFALELINWLVIRGGKNLVLCSRTGIKTGYQELLLRNWKKLGANIVVSTADASSKEVCLELINKARKLGDIVGVFNLAAVLKDGLFESLTLKDIDIVMKPKLEVTRHLDALTRKMCPNLRYFVVFSSTVCGKGNHGQTNYGMANSIAERICEQRNVDGYPGVAIQWGIVGEVGRIAENGTPTTLSDYVEQPIHSCLKTLDLLLTQPNPVVSSTILNKNKLSFGKDVSLFDFILHEILGISNVKAVNFYATFSELGFDSITITVLKQILEKEFDVLMTTPEIRKLTLTRLNSLIDQQRSF